MHHIHRGLVGMILSVLMTQVHGRGALADEQIEKMFGPAADTIMPWLAGQTPFSLSPSGDRLLIKNERTGGGCEMVVRDVADDRIIGRYISNEWPLLLAWQPPGNALSFVEDTHANLDFRLKLWNLASGLVTVPEFPALISAHRVMRWSPDGRYLLSRTESIHGDGLTLITAAAPAADPPIILENDEIKGYSWSPSSAAIAVRVRDQEAPLRVVRPFAPEGTAAGLKIGGSFDAFEWKTAESLLVALRPGKSESSELLEINWVTGARTLRATFPGTGKTIIPLQDGTIILQVNDGGHDAVLLLGKGEEVRRLGIDEGWISDLAVNEAGRKLYFCLINDVASRVQYVVDLASEGPPQVLYDPAEVRSPGRPPVKRSLKSRRGGDIPLLVWMPEGRSTRGVAIRFPNIAGRGEVVSEYNGIIQYLEQAGCGYVYFDFPAGRDGSEIDDRDIADALTVIAYAGSELQIPPDKIVFTATSAATAYLVDTMRKMPEKKGSILINGFVLLPEANPLETPNNFRIGVLQGEYDKVPLAAARAQLADIFGRDAFEDRGGFACTINHEGHNLRLMRSKALRAAAIESLFGTDE